MNNVSERCSGSPVRRAKLPWITFIFLAIIFFAADHDLLFSVKTKELQDISNSIARVTESILSRFIVFPMLGVFGIVCLMRRGKNDLKINGVLGWLILIYIVWASFSFIWADDIALTLRRLLALWMLCLGALAIGKHFSLRAIILWVFFTTAVYLLVGLALEVVLGTFLPFTPGYRFAGTLHPNFQGANCALLLLTGIAAGKAAKRGRWFFRTCALVGLVFLVLTGSRTATASAIVALLVYWALFSSSSRKLSWLLGISIGACLLLLFFGDGLFSTLRQGVLLGRAEIGDDPSSFNNRIPLWKDCLNYAARRPLQGYGYNSFFTPTRIGTFAATYGFPFSEAHSAYLESLLGTGMIGMTSLMSVLILGIKRSFVRFKGSSSSGYACFVAIFIFCLLNGVLESTIVRANTLSFVTMIVLCHLGFRFGKPVRAVPWRRISKACHD